MNGYAQITIREISFRKTNQSAEGFRGCAYTVSGKAMAQGMNVNIPEPLASHRGAVEGLCRRYHVARLALFGSVSRGQGREDSDLDLLVLFQSGHTPGMAFFAFQEELCDVLGRPVDLNTPEDLSRFFRDQVLREAQVVYEA